MKVVVTGATGHLGHCVVERLLQGGHEVVATSRSGALPHVPNAASLPGALLSLKLDLTDEAAVSALEPHLGLDVGLVHLAAERPEGATRASDRSRLLAANTFGTLRVLEAARKVNAGACAIVYACDAEIYGSSSELLSESSRLRPASDYAASKLSGEDHLLAFEDEEGIRCVSLRFGAFYGPGRRTPDTLSSFLASCACGEPMKLSGHARDLRFRVDVRDAALATEQALFTQVSGRINIADEQPLSLTEAASLAFEIVGCAGEPIFEPISADPVRLALDLKRAQGELHFRAQRSLPEALSAEWRALREAP